ncbi:MAG TPA: GNAT family protein [Acidimicrobiales bacterium]|nr:GNAT family protein [Acidimicrobiales bacterium]
MSPAPPAVSIVEPSAAHRADFLSAVRRSRRLHHGWVTPPSNEEEFGRYLMRLAQPDHAGYLVLAGGTPAGVINVNNIVMSSFRSAHLGYYAFAGLDGRGLMTAGLGLVLARAFGPLGLHRVEANVQPGNERSIRLVKRLGFVKEGFSERFLQVAGVWRDHERWALLADRFDPGRVTRG